MKIAVATMNGGLDDQVSPVFGRCPTYTIVEAEGKKIKGAGVIQNQFAAAMGGAGIQAAQYIATQGVNAVIAGNYGPNASAVLSQSNVEMIQAQGPVKDSVDKYLNGELKPVTGPTAPASAEWVWAREWGAEVAWAVATVWAAVAVWAEAAAAVCGGVRQ